MSWFTKARDTIEGAATIPLAAVQSGTGFIAAKVVSKPVAPIVQNTAIASTIAGTVVAAPFVASTASAAVGGASVAGGTSVAGIVAGAKEVSSALKPDNNNTVTPSPIATANPSAPAKDYSGLLVTGGVGLLALKVAGVL